MQELACKRTVREQGSLPQQGSLPLRTVREQGSLLQSGRHLGDARRDYFIVIDAAGRRLWIFRDPRPPGGWFLQGVFA